MKYISIIGLLVVAVLYFSFTSIGNNKTSSNENIINQASSAKVTFVELGSVNCIPCKQMQPIMKSIEEKYGEQVKVIFYDVWKEDQKKYAQQYGIKLIPTQVFLDANGKEFHRHEGFYSEAEIDKILQGKGLTIKK
ncbi:MAG: thioredoxin family protein [Ignavibacterium sp.]|nr:thioredoxin family protein [Ignavibacterium sp.]